MKYKDFFFPKYYPETELRRKFQTKRKQNKSFTFVTKYLEIVSGNIRFLYNLKTNQYFWQFKKVIKSHYVVVPSIEKCTHAVESRPYSSILDSIHKVNPTFFFKNKPTLKTVLYDKQGVTVYERTLAFEKVNYVECELSKGISQYCYFCDYYNATRVEGENIKEPLVVVANKNVALLFYALKWDGCKSIRSVPSDYYLLKGNKYIFEDLPPLKYIMVDVANHLLNPLQRVEHLKAINFYYGKGLQQLYNISVQNFFVFMNTLKSFYRSVDTTPNDGYVGISETQVVKIKPHYTVDLQYISERKHFIDNDGKIYISLKNVVALEPLNDGIYECLLTKQYVVSKIVRHRADKLYPNSYKVVNSCVKLESLFKNKIEQL